MPDVTLPFEIYPQLTMASDGSVKVGVTVNHKLIKGVEHKVRSLEFKLVYSE